MDSLSRAVSQFCSLYFLTHSLHLGFVMELTTACGCRWAGGSGSCAKLLTGSYDGSVRMLDPSTATFELLVTDEEAEYSAMDCLADATSGSAVPSVVLLPCQMDIVLKICPCHAAVPCASCSQTPLFMVF